MDEINSKLWRQDFLLKGDSPIGILDAVNQGQWYEIMTATT